MSETYALSGHKVGHREIDANDPQLSLLCDDLHNRKAKPEPADRLTDAFMLVGFICSLVVSGHSLAAAFH